MLGCQRLAHQKGEAMVMRWLLRGPGPRQQKNKEKLSFTHSYEPRSCPFGVGIFFWDNGGKP